MSSVSRNLVFNLAVSQPLYVNMNVGMISSL